VLKNLYADSSAMGLELATFRRQESIFITIDLLLLAFLLLLHTTFASFWGTPTRALVVVLGLAFLARGFEMIWLHRLSKPLSPVAQRALTWAWITIDLFLAVFLSALTDHEDSPYFALVVVPILESAFRFSLPPVIGVLLLANSLNFYWVRHYFQRHPPVDISEYFEAGIISLIFAIVGLLVWLLVNHLRRKEIHLAHNLLELERTRVKLLQEETLAAVGRLSSAIAHEIRNPVAMISSSLATAARGHLDAPQREEMCDIAAKEAERLEKLTDDFLTYARPRSPQITATPLADTLAYVAGVCRAHASGKGIEVRVEVQESLSAEIDPAQIQQALLNLVMNAVDASPPGGTVLLKAGRNGDQWVHIGIENHGAAIPTEDMPRIFEPFFTTKSKGTGLGLAIARNIARAHGGDLVVATNAPQRVCFHLILRTPNGSVASKVQAKEDDGQNPHR
jgi:two-component system, NtrC family, sensor histidine kinase HydH